MPKSIVPTAKEINDAHRLAKTSAETAVEHAIRCGTLLIAKKTDLEHGEFEAWCTKNCTFSERTARLYMKAAKDTAQGLAFDSLRDLFPKPARRNNLQASGRQNGNALPFSNEISREIVGISENSGAAVAIAEGAGNGPEQTPIATQQTEPETGFDFTDYEPEDDEAYRKNIDNVMMADDKLKAMRDELKSVHREMQALKSSRDHYQSESGQAVRLLKARDREIEKLKKQVEELRAENEKLNERISIMESA